MECQADAGLLRVERFLHHYISMLYQEGRLYHRPTLLHYIAAYIKRKERVGEVTSEDVADAARYLLTFVDPLLKDGVPKRRIWRKFMETHAQLYRLYPQAPKSYQAFKEALERARKLLAKQAG